jgi:hypothetical protein
VPDMLGGQVQVVFSPVPTTIEQVRQVSCALSQ